MTELKRLRLQKRISQREASERIGVSLRTYVTYENDASKERTAKYRFLLSEIVAMNSVDEEHGVLAFEDIQRGCAEVLCNSSKSRSCCGRICRRRLICSTSSSWSETSNCCPKF